MKGRRSGTLRDGSSRAGGGRTVPGPASGERPAEVSRADLALLDDFPALIWRSSLDGRCDYFNRAWLDFTGRTLEQELGEGWSEGVHPDDRERTVHDYLDAFNARRPFVLEYRLRHRDGEYRLIRDIGNPLFDPSGEFTGYIGGCFDLSERERTAESLRLSEERFSRIFHSSPVAIAIGTIDEHRLIDVNDSFLELFGYRRDEVIGRTAGELELTLDAAQREELIRRAVAGETVRDVEVQHRRKSGEVGYALFSGDTLRLQNGPVWVTTRIDITERKRAEEALRKSEELFALFAHHMQGAIFVKDAQGRYVYANPVVEAAQNVAPGGWLGKTDGELFPPETAQQFRANDREVLDSRQAMQTVEIIPGDGVRHWLVNKFPIPGGQESGLLLGGAAFEITDLMRAESALRESEQHLSRVLEERERLAQDLHDHIVQEIYAIGMELEECRHIVPGKPNVTAVRLGRAIGNLNGVIREVRRYIGRKESRKLTGAQLRSELAHLVPAIGATGHLRFRFSIDPLAVDGLSGEIAEQVLNIAREALSNSLRHSQARHGKLALYRGADGVYLDISDDGAGFDVESTGSTGSGLRNMQNRARQIGAQLEIRSAPGEGTRIVLCIPGAGISDDPD